MKRAVFLAAALLAASAGLRAQPDVTEFFPVADSVTEHPPFRTELTTFHQVRVNQRWVSFVGFQNTRTVLYVTFTLDSLDDPVRDVSQTVGFEKARPTLGKVSTWGYPFDRNRDGKIDYLALVGGAAPFEDGDFPPNYPKQSEQVMIHHVELFIAKCKIVFNHWADDNYDGMIDGAVMADMDPERNWVYRRILARSKKFDGILDDVWAFRTDTSSFLDSVSYGPERVSYRPIGTPPGSFGKKELDEKSAVMILMNEAIAACEKGSFRLPGGYREQAEQE
ncbi:MAG TPA: hypothetical protein VI932_06190 [Bacteroidota bacterium]|nr:hypothetical protein [Bacteroidota bacterium]